jgi:hypothetical protein
MKRFLVIIEKSGSNYSAYFPDLPGCVATGKTKSSGCKKNPPGNRKAFGGPQVGPVAYPKTPFLSRVCGSDVIDGLQPDLLPKKISVLTAMAGDCARPGALRKRYSLSLKKEGIRPGASRGNRRPDPEPERRGFLWIGAPVAESRWSGPADETQSGSGDPNL